MKKNILLLFSLFLVLNCFAQEAKDSETSVYYLIRHAEKDRSDKTNKNPNLTEKGQNRAHNWAKMFQHITFDAVYSTEYNRTQQTAAPTAKTNELKVITYHPYKINFEDFLKDTKGKTVLIVGHSNTTPAFTNKLLGEEKFESIDDNNNGNVYIVTITGDTKSVQLLTIN
ncbi:phosphoglycerate mutase family protein [uncultured Kordia sp.]|uniref:SixA phosphatase family protein n=1 Tax=uncultured Kordia sp. TaxID=507699 RepID=UPI00260D805B|nr:phosphoglycerate mutase family protein [uncultured Kordia sp.]